MKIMRNVSIVFAVLMSTCALFAGPIHEWAKLGKSDKIKQFESLQKRQNKAIKWDEQDAEGKTPLMLAALGGHDQTVVYLLSYGANPAITDKKGKTAFDYAATDSIRAKLAPKKGQTLAAQSIKNGTEPQLVVTSPTKAPVIAHPVQQAPQPINYKKELEKMTQLQAELTSVACEGNLDLVIKTVEMGANVSSPDIIGNTPLIAAIKCYQMPIDGHNHLAVIDYLLSKGASILIHDKDGKNALHYAIEHENKHIVNRLINSLHNNPNKAEIVNAQDRNGDTALHYAAATSSFDLIKTLLKNGAYKDAHNKAGKYPLDVLGTKQSISEVNRQNMKKNSIEIRQLLSLDTTTPAASTTSKNVSAGKPTQTADESSDKGRSRGSTIFIKPIVAHQDKTARGEPGIVTFDQETGDTHIEVPASDDESGSDTENNN